MLNRLPDETILEIVNKCVDPRPFAHATLVAPPLHESKPFEAMKWSHLSRRFCALMRNTSNLWTWVSSAMHPELIQECLKLSKGSTLDVEMRAERTDIEAASLQVLLQDSSSTRWASLVMRINIVVEYPHEDQTEEEAREIVDDFYIDLSNLKLPRLSRLCLVHQLVEDEAFTEELQWSTKWFEETYETWNAPHIREVVTNGDDLPLHLASAISNLTISLHTVETVEFFSRFISTFSSVHELRIWSSRKKDRFDGARQMYDGSPVSMPNVSVLRLEWDVGVSWAANDIAIFFKWILFPNLKELHIDLLARDCDYGADNVISNVDNPVDNPLDAVLFEALPSRKIRFPTISTVELHIHGILPSLPNNWAFPVEQFFGIRHLILRNVSAETFPSDAWDHTSLDRPTALETITLEDCERITTKDVALLLDALTNETLEGERKSQLESIAIARCKNIVAAELEKLSGGTKISVCG